MDLNQPLYLKVEFTLKLKARDLLCFAIELKVNIQKNLVTSWQLFKSIFFLFLSFQAEACKSIEYAMKKCPNGMYSEIKYDGERVQVHKNGDNFSYFSRSLKPVLPHKVSLSHTQLHNPWSYVLISVTMHVWMGCP